MAVLNHRFVLLAGLKVCEREPEHSHHHFFFPLNTCPPFYLSLAVTLAGYDGDVLYDYLYSFKVNLKILPQISEIIPLEIVHNIGLWSLLLQIM